MRRLFFGNRRILPADAMEKVRYIVDPRMDDEHSLGNRKLIASIKVVSAEKLIIQFQSGIVMEQEIRYE